MAEEPARVSVLEYVDDGNAGITFGFDCVCRSRVYISERPWWIDDGVCPNCGRRWTLNLFVECEAPD